MNLRRIGIVIISIAVGGSSALAQEREIGEIEGDLANVRAQIEAAKSEATQYSGGLIQALILQRLETLRLTEALLDQRRIALREGAQFTFSVPATRPDPAREAKIIQDLLNAKRELSEAESEASRYSGGLVLALAISNVMTQRQTVAILHQAALAARYGLTIANIDPGAVRQTEGVEVKQPTPAETPQESPKMQPARDCLKVADFGSITLDYNDTFAQVAWKVDVQNSCDTPFYIRVRFVLKDVEEFELDSDTKTIKVPANGMGKARGQMLVSPTSVYDRAKYNSVSYSLVR